MEMSMPTKVRQFWAGVCALEAVPRLTDAINGWTTRREEIVRGSFLRLLEDLGYEHDSTLRWLNDQAIESDYLPPKWHARVGKLEQQLAAECGAHNETKAVVESIRASWVQLQAQLVAEREAHEQTRIELGLEKAAHGVANQAELRAEQLLANARADLDALTRWRLQSDEPCPVLSSGIRIEMLDSCTVPCHTLSYPEELLPKYQWRHTTESLAAWKARKGARDES